MEWLSVKQHKSNSDIVRCNVTNKKDMCTFMKNPFYEYNS